VPDGVCGSYSISVQPGESLDPSVEDAPEPIESSVELCPDVASAPPPITVSLASGQLGWSKGVHVQAKHGLARG
jgi:hypothetical protein